MLSKAFVILMIGFALFGSSCIFDAYTTVADVADSMQQYTIEDMQIRIDALEGEMRVLNLRQDYLEEILILLLEPHTAPHEPDERKEEVDHAI